MRHALFGKFVMKSAEWRRETRTSQIFDNENNNFARSFLDISQTFSFFHQCEMIWFAVVWRKNSFLFITNTGQCRRKMREVDGNRSCGIIFMKMKVMWFTFKKQLVDHYIKQNNSDLFFKPALFS